MGSDRIRELMRAALQTAVERAEADARQDAERQKASFSASEQRMTPVVKAFRALELELADEPDVRVSASSWKVSVEFPKHRYRIDSRQTGEFVVTEERDYCLPDHSGTDQRTLRYKDAETAVAFVVEKLGEHIGKKRAQYTDREKALLAKRPRR